MVRPDQVLTAPTIVDHEAKRLVNGKAVGADVRPGPQLIRVVPLLDVRGGIVAANGTGLSRGSDNDDRNRGGEKGTAHSRHHSPTKAFCIATVVVSTGRSRQLRNLWWNRRRLPKGRGLAIAELALEAISR